MMPTVIVLNDYCHINGGASRIAIDEAVGLAHSGLRVIFFGACGPICDELRNAPLEVVCLGQRELIEAGRDPRVMLQGLWNVKAGRAMAKILSTLDPAHTVIHLHGYTKALTTSPVRAASKRGFRVLCTLHDFFSACPNGALFDYRESRVCERVCLSMDCVTAQCDKRHYAHKLYRVVRSVIQRSFGRLPGGVKDYITLSRRSAELLAPYLPKDAHYHALENLIETSKRPPVDVSANPALVAVGRLDVEKGIEPLLAAIRKTGLPLTLIGDGPLRAEAEATPGCRVTGWLTPAGVQAELEKARCLIFPSIWYEAYGLVVSEAASRGIPTVASDISAAAERITHGVEGWHVKAGDVDDLAARLMQLADDETVKAAGQAAYHRFWASPPTREYHMQGLIAIYRLMLAR